MTWRPAQTAAEWRDRYGEPVTLSQRQMVARLEHRDRILDEMDREFMRVTVPGPGIFARD